MATDVDTIDASIQTKRDHPIILAVILVILMILLRSIVGSCVVGCHNRSHLVPQWVSQLVFNLFISELIRLCHQVRLSGVRNRLQHLLMTRQRGITGIPAKVYVADRHRWCYYLGGRGPGTTLRPVGHPNSILGSAAFIVAFGVLLDTFIVRSLLVPH